MIAAWVSLRGRGLLSKNKTQKKCKTFFTMQLNPVNIYMYIFRLSRSGYPGGMTQKTHVATFC